MRFASEEEVDSWYADEKSKLDEVFQASIQKDPDKIPENRARYEQSLKKLIAKYQGECEKFL